MEDGTLRKLADHPEYARGRDYADAGIDPKGRAAELRGDARCAFLVGYDAAREATGGRR